MIFIFEVGSVYVPYPMPRHKLPFKQTCPPNPPNLDETLEEKLCTNEDAGKSVEANTSSKKEHNASDEEDEAKTPPPLPPRTTLNSPLSMVIPISPRMPTSPIPSSPPQKLVVKHG